MSEVILRVFGYMVDSRYIDSPEEMLRESYSYIKTGESIDVAIEALREMGLQHEVDVLNWFQYC